MFFLAKWIDPYSLLLVNKQIDEFKYRYNNNVKEGFGAMLLINIRDLNIEYGLFLISCTQAIDLS